MRSIAVAGAVAAALVALATPAQAQLGPPFTGTLPDGEGKDLVAASCGQCHTLSVVLTMRAGLQGWRHQVYDMVIRGAQLDVAEAETVTRYLATFYGPGSPLPGLKPDPVALPAGQGKELVEANCGMCHDLGRMTGVKRTKSEWEGIVARMVFLGAPSDPEDSKKIVAYLDAQFGKK
jgi:cytochrome c5